MRPVNTCREFDRKERSARGANTPYILAMTTDIQAKGGRSSHGSRKRADDERWNAVKSRDARFDGAFYYSVATTGVYCRPSCASRLARRENVAFHASCADAERAGFRPCKRCKPDEPSMQDRAASKIAAACRMIADSEVPPKLEALANAAGLSPHHFHRLFKAVVGVTPKAYAEAHRQNSVRAALATSESVTQALYAAGYSSSGRFYEKSSQVLGMTPTAFRAGGKDAEMRFAIGQCSLGAILVAASVKGVTAILLGDDPDALLRDLEDRFPGATLIGGDPAFDALVAGAVGLVEAPEAGHDLPLDIRGTAFQRRVWQALRDIPAGTTSTYTEVANCIGQPKAVRAVAAACAANKIALAIPCHRVIRNDGSLSGYRWGVERKRELLTREAAAKPRRAASKR